MNMINLHYQVVQDKKSVLITPSDRKKYLSKPEDRPTLRKHPKTQNNSKGIDI